MMINTTTNQPNGDSNNLSQAVKLLNKELSNLEKAYQKLLEAKPSVREARQKVEMYFTEVMRLLRKRVIRETLDNILRDLPDDPTATREFLEAFPQKFIKDEAQSVRPMRLSQENIVGIIKSALKSSSSLSIPFSNADEFYRKYEDAHREALDKIEESRELSRKKKNKQKRKVAEGCCGITAGLALSIGNTVVAASTAITVLASVSLGANRLINGYNTIVESGS